MKQANRPKKSTHKNNMSIQQSQDFGNQSSIIQDQNNVNKVEITNASLQLLDDVDQKWMEFKIVGKNISRRSYHTAAIYDGYMYIYGGYDVNTGILDDFWRMNIDEPEKYQWQSLTPPIQQPEEYEDAEVPSLVDIIPNYPGPRERHQAIVYDDKMYIFGGLKKTLESTNTMYTYNFKTRKWSQVEYKGGDLPYPIDSHSFVLNEAQSVAYLCGGFFSDENNGGYNKFIYQFDLQTSEWSIISKDSEKHPQPRAGASICCVKDKLFMFGGTNVAKKFSDFWYFSNGQWNEIEQNQRPESRNGHSLIGFEGQILLFGGIHDITHEKNDLMIIDSQTLEWKVVDSDTSHAKEEGELSQRDNKYEEADNKNYLTKSQKNTKNLQRTFQRQPDIYNKKHHQPSKRMYQTMKEKTDFRGTQNESEMQNNKNTVLLNEEGTMNQMEEMKKKRQEMKKVALLNEFKLNDNEQEQYQSNSPTTIAMKNSIISVGNPEGNKKYDLKAATKGMGFNKPFDFTKNKIIGKAPSARDGQSAVVFENYCVIFGGDRHLMAYNDIFQIDLEMATGIKMEKKPKKEKKILQELEDEEAEKQIQQQQQEQQQQQQQQQQEEKNEQQQQQGEEQQQQQQPEENQNTEQQQQNPAITEEDQQQTTQGQEEQGQAGGDEQKEE